MNTVWHLLSRVKACGVTVGLSRDNCNLKCRGPKQALEPETLAGLKKHKAEIVRLLRDNATALTAREFSFESTLESHQAQMLKRWRTEIEAAWLPRPISDHDVLRSKKFDLLETASLSFLDDGHAFDAVRSGWSPVQLFGVHRCDATAERLDTLGLVPLIAWGSLNLELQGIGAEHAHLTTSTGALLKHPRFKANHSEALPWWQHPQFNHQQFESSRNTM